MSLKSKILNYLKEEYPRIVHKGEIGRIAISDWKYENENAGRRCRELENEKLILRVLDSKRQAQYQYIPQNATGANSEPCARTYKPTQERLFTPSRIWE